jgi:hypothetical protein
VAFTLDDIDELLAMKAKDDAANEGDLIAGDVSWKTVRRLIDRKSEKDDEWQGFPVPLPGIDCRLHDRHPMREKIRQFQLDVALGREDELKVTGERVVNEWFSRRIGKYVIIVEHSDGRRETIAYWKSPDCSMDRLNFWLQTIGASDAWDWDAERKAKAKLRAMVTPRAYRHYDLTGSFFETSPRSGLTYVFRRLRPTIVLSPRPTEAMVKRGSDHMRCLCCLCFHPIGYYEETWAGCLVPTDDVIAHVEMMRGDEAYYWRKANQHAPHLPEAGL